MEKEGGWSLEAPDPDQMCTISQEWEYSVDLSGGTPGRVNSVDALLEDHQAPVFLYCGFGDHGNIHLHFSEPLSPFDEPGESGEGDWQVVIQPGNLISDQVVLSKPIGDQLICSFIQDPTLLPGFRINVPDVVDCQGNYGGDINVRSGAVLPPEYGTVLISEIMYSPEEGDAEYIELYHPGPGCTDLKNLALDVVREGESPEGFIPLSDHSRILSPGEFVVLTRDKDHLVESYHLQVSGCWTEVSDLKSLPATGGMIYLADRSGNTIDLAMYDDGMHMDLIDDTHGISLERISMDRSGTEPGNWHSAASIAGFASPGILNSQSQPETVVSQVLTIEPKVFSPNNDGYNDLLGVTVTTPELGFLVRLRITDLSGVLVNELANNHISGPESKYSWNGEDMEGRLVGEGLYVIHLTGIQSESGQKLSKKAAIGVVY
jgi:hypothetical protein